MIFYEHELLIFIEEAFDTHLWVILIELASLLIELILHLKHVFASFKQYLGLQRKVFSFYNYKMLCSLANP